MRTHTTEFVDFGVRLRLNRGGAITIQQNLIGRRFVERPGRSNRNEILAQYSVLPLSFSLPPSLSVFLLSLSSSFFKPFSLPFFICLFVLSIFAFCFFIVPLSHAHSSVLSAYTIVSYRWLLLCNIAPIFSSDTPCSLHRQGGPLYA